MPISLTTVRAQAAKPLRREIIAPTHESVPQLRPLEIADLPQVAAIHALAFPNGALTKLGPETLRRFYEWQLLGPHEVYAAGLFLQEQCTGYCFAGVFKGTATGFLHHNLLFLARQILTHPALIFNPLVRERLYLALGIIKRTARKRLFSHHECADEKCLALTEQPGKKSFGILAMAVKPAQQQRGAGKMLMQNAEKIARQSGFHEANLTVHPTNTQAIRFYEGLGWTKVAPDGIWKGRMEKHLEPLL